MKMSEKTKTETLNRFLSHEMPLGLRKNRGIMDVLLVFTPGAAREFCCANTVMKMRGHSYWRE